MVSPFDHFIDPMRSVFADPTTSESSEKGTAVGFYARLATSLSDAGYSEEALTIAANRLMSAVRDPKDGRFFPRFSECVAACEDAKRGIEVRQRVMIANGEKHKAREEEAIRDRFAEEALRDRLAMTAVQGHWITGFQDFCRKHGRLPTNVEAQKCAADTRAFFAQFQREADNDFLLRRMLKALRNREKMLESKVKDLAKEMA